MNNGKVSILGTEYKVTEGAGLGVTEIDGQCMNYKKMIQIRVPADMLEQDASEAEKRIRYEEVMRHEIVHAFLFESGLDEYFENEQLVNWIANSVP